MKTKFNILAAAIFLAAVTAGFGQPSITTQPQHQTNRVGTTATFWVVATGTPTLAHQWQKLSGTWSDLVGCTDTNLCLTNVQTSHAGDYRVVVTNVDGAAISDVAHLTVIVPPTLQFTATTFTVAENAGLAILTVQRTGDTNATVTVDYATANGTAMAGSDYTATNGTLTFLAGETNQLIIVPVLNDSAVEVATYETFTVTLSNPTGGAVLGTRTTATARITDNDKGLAFEFTYYRALEDEGAILIGVVRADDGDFPVSVDFATSDLAATNGLDYAATNGTLSFADGEKVKLFTVPILNDALKESTETFRLTLSNPTNQVLGIPKVITVQVLDNDPGVQFTRNQHWVHEYDRTVLLTVARGNDGLLGAFTVDYASTNLTAIAGQDYIETHGTLEFTAGEMTKSFAVPVLDDGVAEVDKQFKVHLSNPTGGMALGAAASVTATVTVCDLTEMAPHGFDSIQVSPEGIVSLTLRGGFTLGVGLANRFQPFCDLYPLEVSTNLLDWSPLALLVRTNAYTNKLVYTDAKGAQSSQRFYRVPSRTFITPNVPPSGPYAVGRMDRWLTDPTRRNRFFVSTNSSFQVAIWYPATARAGSWPLPCMDEQVLRDNDYWTGWLDRTPDFVGYAAGDLDLASTQVSYPIVLISAGYHAARNDLWEQGDELASHGYVVVSPEHSDVWGVVLPDGSYSSGGEGKDGTEAGLRSRVRDLSFVVDQLEQWNVSDPFFAGHLDLNRIATLGFSWGGATALEFCRVDARCRAAVALDPGGFYIPELLSVGLQKPSLTINRSDDADKRLFDKALTNAFWFQISSTVHLDIGGQGWLPDGSITSTRLGWEVNRTVNAYTAWFLNKYLNGSATPMPPLAAYPRIINFKQK